MEGVIAKFVLIWVVGVLAPGQSGYVTSRERIQFSTIEECRKFAKEHEVRMADWVRGLRNLDWDIPVRVAWGCTDGSMKG